MPWKQCRTFLPQSRSLCAALWASKDIKEAVNFGERQVTDPCEVVAEQNCDVGVHMQQSRMIAWKSGKNAQDQKCAGQRLPQFKEAVGQLDGGASRIMHSI